MDSKELKINSEDLYDIAYKWGWEEKKLKELVYLCYKTPNYKENAQRFHASEEFTEALEVLKSLRKQPDKSVELLDFGCGNGVAAYSFARAGYSVTALDSSIGELAGINAAKKLVGLDNAYFDIVHAVGENGIDFEDNTFDVVWLREVFHHIKDLEGFLKEIKRILKKDGIVCCIRDHVIWNEEQRKDFFESHPFYHITKDEGCYYLHEYTNAFRNVDLKLELVLDPCSSVINWYPQSKDNVGSYNIQKSIINNKGNDLFSFFARKTEENYGDIQN